MDKLYKIIETPISNSVSSYDVYVYVPGLRSLEYLDSHDSLDDARLYCEARGVVVKESLVNGG